MRRSVARSHSRAARTVVHLLLLLTVTASLAIEPVLALHVALGLTFVALVGIHLGQRRRTVRALAGRVSSLPTTRQGRIAVADALLAVVTAAMLVSGVVDWALGHPTRIRWHAITGVVLALAVILHTVRRRRRLRRSVVR